LISEEFSSTRENVWEELKFLFDDYLKEKESVLDLGCGNGRYYEFFKNKNINYVGADNSGKLIDIAKRKYGEEKFVAADALKLPFPDNSFDKVYSIAVLHHFPSKELRNQFLSEAKRVLKTNGLLILTVWKFHQTKEWISLFKYTVLKILGLSKLDFRDIFEPWGKKTERYYHWFSIKELAGLAEEAGFKIKKIGVIKNKRGNRQNIYLVAKK